MKKILIIATLAVAALAGCNEQSPASLRLQKHTATTAPLASEQDRDRVIPGSSSGRFEIQRVDVFRDDLAYEKKRGIYILIDRSTGKEYVGISGIGISELGSHQSGKTTSKDER